MTTAGQLERLDPADLDLDTADALAAVARAANDEVAPEKTAPTGPTLLKLFQHGQPGSRFGGLWLARDGDTLLGYAAAGFPERENTGTFTVDGAVLPAHRRRGIGRALHEAATDAARADGRTTAYSGALDGSAGVPALHALGYRSLHTYAVGQLDLYDGPWPRWDRLYDEALGHAADYELVRLVGSTPPEHVDDVVALFAAINDAPMTDPGSEPDRWDADRVRGYDTTMSLRRQTVYRVLARHCPTGAWAGHTLLCVDEFDPSVAHQEDTSVVVAHRGHRLGLLLKIEMLRWVAAVRPEVRATETWNSTANHHMLAVNERLGTRVVARHVNMRRTP
ncbi:MAG: N-acetyltransferase family protein [Nocardioidaceae bacterium]